MFFQLDTILKKQKFENVENFNNRMICKFLLRSNNLVDCPTLGYPLCRMAASLQILSGIRLMTVGWLLVSWIVCIHEIPSWLFYFITNPFCVLSCLCAIHCLIIIIIVYHPSWPQHHLNNHETLGILVLYQLNSIQHLITLKFIPLYMCFNFFADSFRIWLPSNSIELHWLHSIYVHNVIIIIIIIISSHL